MARYPTVGEYNKTPEKAQDGIQRCDEFLKKAPNDIKLLTTKLQLLQIAQSEPAQPLLEHIAQLESPPTQIEDLTAIEDAAVQLSRKGVYPYPDTAGPHVSELWEKAMKSSSVPLKYKLDLLSVRFQRAVVDNRRQDVQQTLIQLKKYVDGNKIVYFAHAAATQLLSKDNGNDLPGKLALGLAKKAIKEGFDAEKDLDCRVVGQILALQDAKEDLEGIKERQPFVSSALASQALNRWELSKATTEQDSTAKSTAAAEPGLELSKTSPDELVVNESEALEKKLRKILSTSPSDASALEAFAAEAAQLFYKATHELKLQRLRTPAQAAFLAISALVALADVSENSFGHLLQAAFIAEQLLVHSYHIHEAKLILIYIYQSLGLGSLAATHYAALSIKEVQFDTVGHTLFTDIAITHPFPAAVPASPARPNLRFAYDPLNVILNQALPVYQRCEDRLADCEADVLSHGQTGMIFELAELRSKLRDSVTRRLYELEYRRVMRVTGATSNKATATPDPRPLSYWSSEVLKDNRDFNSAFNYGLNLEKLLHSSTDASESLLRRLASDTVWSLARSQQPLVSDVEELLQALSKASTTSDKAGKIAKEQATERQLANVSTLLLKLLHASDKDASTVSKAQVEQISAAIDSLAIDTQAEESSPATPAILHFLRYFDALKLVHASASKMALIQNLPDGAVKALSAIQERAQTLFEKLQARAKELHTDSTSAYYKTSLLGEGDSTAPLRITLNSLPVGAFTDKISQSVSAGWECFNLVKLA